MIAAIEDKGEDGPHFIDGLIDFANYVDNKKAGRPHSSYFNAYIDGKTNGLAANGIQMGHIPTAERTGVLRNSKDTLLDDGDIREALKNIANDLVDGEGWNGDNTAAIGSELSTVAKAVFSHKPLNKATTMTFGYGREIESFGSNIKDTLNLLSETEKPGSEYHAALAAIDSTMDRKTLADVLMSKYSRALSDVMSDDAIESRALMRGAAMLHSATNQLFKIKGPVGNDLHLGKAQATGETEGDTSYSIKAGDKTVPCLCSALYYSRYSCGYS